jgi:hypothetical protein
MGGSSEMSASGPLRVHKEGPRRLSALRICANMDSYSTIFQYESLRITFPLRNV